MEMRDFHRLYITDRSPQSLLLSLFLVWDRECKSHRLTAAGVEVGVNCVSRLNTAAAADNEFSMVPVSANVSARVSLQ